MRSVKVTTQLYRKLFSTFHERLPSLKPEILKRLQKECANVRALAKPPTRYRDPCGRAPRMQNLLEITVHFLPPVQMAMISGGSNVFNEMTKTDGMTDIIDRLFLLFQWLELFRCKGMPQDTRSRANALDLLLCCVDREKLMEAIIPAKFK